MQTHTHTHARTHTQTECNKSSSSSRGGGGGGDGRLLSEFLVELVFVCEAGRGYNCSHVDWSEGEKGGIASRFGCRLAQVSGGGELVKAAERGLELREREWEGCGGGAVVTKILCWEEESPRNVKWKAFFFFFFFFPEVGVHRPASCLTWCNVLRLLWCIFFFNLILYVHDVFYNAGALNPRGAVNIDTFKLKLKICLLCCVL